MDHQTFQSHELEELYEELESADSEALREHAATCASCAARLERLRAARERGRSVLAEPVSPDFESRILAAVDAALGSRAGAPALAAVTASAAEARGPTRPETGAKVFSFFSRPSFAVAASFILVLGAAALFLQVGGTRQLAPMAASMDEAPAASALPGAPGAEVAAAGLPPPAPEPAATATSNTLQASPVATPRAAHAPPSVVAQPAPRAEPRPATKGARPAPNAAGAAQDPAFASAKSLYDADNCAEALPKFEALKGTHPEASRYAARCVQKLRQARPVESGAGAGAPATAPAAPPPPAQR